MTIYQVFVDFNDASKSGLFEREVTDHYYGGNGYWINGDTIFHDRLHKLEVSGNKLQYLTDDFEDARAHHITMMKDAIKYNLEIMNKAKTAVDTFEALINVANMSKNNNEGDKQ